MRRTLVIVLLLVLVLGVLVALNAASYVQVERKLDSEIIPDRSTFNAGPTGTMALYDLLRESGRQVVRWRESPTDLLGVNGAKLATLVIVGRTVVPIKDDEAKTILRWVSNGGRLVIIDREPESNLLPKSSEWRISVRTLHFPSFDTDPNNIEQLTAETKPVAPVQPTALVRNVDSILPSRFAGGITIITKMAESGHTKPAQEEENDTSDSEEEPDSSLDSTPDSSPNSTHEPESSEAPLPPPNARTQAGKATIQSPAPVVHVGTEDAALLVDYRRGKGRILLLSDPFICANNGISRADNLQLALNVIEGDGGLVAFDEFHQGRAATHNALIQYFSGTPLLALCGQLALIALLVVWSRGKRFARPLPLPHVDRRSSLEFVASMAELQQRSRAHDLALENIYGRVRRVLVRYAGASNHTPRAVVAAKVAARSHLNQSELESLMRNCEDVINGAPSDTRRSLDLARRLRKLEAALGLRMRSRETKQRAERN